MAVVAIVAVVVAVVLATCSQSIKIWEQFGKIKKFSMLDSNSSDVLTNIPGSTLDNTPSNAKRNKSTRIIITLLLLGFFSLSYFYFVNKNQTTPSLTTHQTLLSTSKTYKEGEDFNSQGAYDKSIEKYNAAMSDAKSLSQEMLIKLKIAWATKNAGDNFKAVDLFKDIVSSQTYASDVPEVKQAKAIALIGLSSVFYQTRDKAISEKIFSGKPYEDFIKQEDGDDITIAYRRLMEYASSLSSFPDLLAESHIAMWYALKIYELKHKQTVTEEEKTHIQEYTVIVKTKLAYVDSHSRDPQNYYGGSRNTNLPFLLRFKAISMGALMVSGDASLGNPEEVFLQALSLPQDAWTKSQTKFAYAVFLAAAYKEQRKNDISDLLSDVYDPPTGSEFNWRTLLSNEKDNPTLAADTIKVLVAVDPKFKAFLLSLGWKF